MQLEIKTEGVEFVVSRLPQPKNDTDGRQKADRTTGEPLFTTELVAMDDTGAEVIKVTTAGEPKVVKRQGVAVRRLVATPWNVDGRGGVAFRADAITPFTASPSGGGAKAAASAGAGA
jgi:predicted deacylase